MGPRNQVTYPKMGSQNGFDPQPNGTSMAFGFSLGRRLVPSSVASSTSRTVPCLASGPAESYWSPPTNAAARAKPQDTWKTLQFV